LFDENNTLTLRYSVSKEDGFMPQNLPGFGFYHDNAAQHASGIYTRVVSPRLVNTASLAMSRLAMSHFSENSSSNDIVDELGITGVGFGGKAGWGAPYFNVQSYSPSAIHGWPRRCRRGTPSSRRAIPSVGRRGGTRSNSEGARAV